MIKDWITSLGILLVLRELKYSRNWSQVIYCTLQSVLKFFKDFTVIDASLASFFISPRTKLLLKARVSAFRFIIYAICFRDIFQFSKSISLTDPSYIHYCFEACYQCQCLRPFFITKVCLDWFYKCQDQLTNIYDLPYTELTLKTVHISF